MLFFEPTVLNDAACTARFTAKDGDTVLGTCDLLLHDGVADLVAVQLTADDCSVGEGLFRAALNFAANRDYYIGVCSAPDAQDVRARLPFREKDGQWQGDIPSLLMGTCGSIDK